MTPSTLPRLVAIALAAFACHAQALVFAVNEGVSYRVPNDEVRARYAAIAADLAKLLREPVTIEPVGDYRSLRKGLADKRYDLALVHPAHVSIEAIKSAGWHLVAVTKGYQDYRTTFLVKADSTLKTLADLKGHSLGLPDEDSITAWMARATVRDALGHADEVRYAYTRYQDAVPFFVDNSLTNAGATASAAVVKDWQTKGGRVLAQSKPVPIKHVIASPALPAEEVGKIREYLLGLDASDEGQRHLEPTHYKGFAAYDQAELLKLGAWLGV